jgi:hypothetical protein
VTATNNPTNSKQRYATMQLLHPSITLLPGLIGSGEADGEGY